MSLVLTIRVAAGREAEHEVVDCLNMELLRLAELGFVDDTDDDGWAWRYDEPKVLYQIRSLDEFDDDGEPLRWSNKHGWVRGGGDTFTVEDTMTLELPQGGVWVARF